MKYFYDRFWLGNQDRKINDFYYKWPAITPLVPTDMVGAILDFGCGDGLILREVAKRNPKARLIGIDVSRVALRKAKQAVPQARFWKIREGEKLPLHSRSVDFLLILDVIEHIYDSEMILKELARVLTPGGKILLTTPYHGLVKNILIVLFAFETVFDPLGPHIRFYTKKSLQYALKLVGIRPFRFGYYGRFYPINRGMYVLGVKSG